MLPAWATVVIALGASLIGALAGVTGSYFTLRGARLNIEHTEREAWRSRRIEAAQEFSEVVVRMVGRFYQLLHADEPFVKGYDAVSDEFDADQILAAHTYLRVALLFGDTSPVGESADNASTKLGQSVELARGLGAMSAQEQNDGVEELESDIDDAADEQDRFMGLAHEAVRPAVVN